MRERILDSSAGIPRVAEELARTWIETPPEGRAAGCPGPVPPTLYGALRARLDELEPELRELAALGAVLGPLFSWELVTAMVEVDSEELRSRLDRLVEAGFLERHGALERLRFAFRLPLLRDAAYASLVDGGRRELHAQVAELLAGRFASLVEERPEILAWHRRAANRRASSRREKRTIGFTQPPSRSR